MSKIRIPDFLAKKIKTLPEEEKKEWITQYKIAKTNRVIELMLEELEKELSRLTLADERDDLISKFQFQTTRAKRLGERKKLRQLINYFK